MGLYQQRPTTSTASCSPALLLGLASGASAGMTRSPGSVCLWSGPALSPCSREPESPCEVVTARLREDGMGTLQTCHPDRIPMHLQMHEWGGHPDVPAPQSQPRPEKQPTEARAIVNMSFPPMELPSSLQGRLTGTTGKPLRDFRGGKGHC